MARMTVEWSPLLCYLFCQICQILEVQSCWRLLLLHSVHWKAHCDPMMQLVIALYWRQKLKIVFYKSHLPIHIFPTLILLLQKSRRNKWPTVQHPRTSSTPFDGNRGPLFLLHQPCIWMTCSTQCQQFIQWPFRIRVTLSSV